MQRTKIASALFLFLAMMVILPTLAAQAGLNREQNELDVIQAGPDFEAEDQQDNWEPGRPTSEIRVPARLSPLGHIGGYVSSPVIRGNLAYVGVGNELRVFSLADKSNPVPVGTGLQLSGIVSGIAVAGNHAYVLSANYGLHIVDVGNPSAPVEIGFFPKSTSMPYLNGIDVAGGLAYVTTGNGLAIIDVNNLQAPTILGTVDIPGGGANDVVLANGYAYVTNMQGLLVIGLSQPAQPTILGSIGTPGFAQDVAVVGHYAYLADANEGLRVIDVSIPQAPTEVGFYPSSGIRNVAADSHYAYFPYGSSLQIVDVSNPRSPFEAAHVITRGSGELAVANGYAYLTGGAHGSFEIIDVATPTSAQVVGTFDNILGTAYEAAVSEGLAYFIAGSEFQIVDISAPAMPVEQGFTNIASCVAGVALKGNHAYAGGLTYTTVIDVSRPESIASINYLPWAMESMEIRGDYLFGIDRGGATPWSLQIANIANPQQVTSLSTLPFATYAGGIAITDSLVLVARGYDGLQVIDASNVTQPRALSMLNLGAFAYAVDAQPGFAYVATSDGGVRVVNISNPALPVEVGHLHLPGSSRDIAVAGSYAFVAAGPRGLYVVDISVPARPVAVA